MATAVRIVPLYSLLLGVFIMGTPRKHFAGNYVNGILFLREDVKTTPRRGVFQCPICGEEFECVIFYVASGNTKSCGCLIKESPRQRFTKHGLNTHPVYTIWTGIKARCYNKNASSYDRYGGRGIKLHDKWLNDFQSFYDYVTSLEGYDESNLGHSGLTLDRKNSLGNYELNNVRWADGHIQRVNQSQRSDNSSGYTGVCKAQECSSWVAYITVRGITHYLGCFPSRKEALEARNSYIIEHDLKEYEIQEWTG